MGSNVGKEKEVRKVKWLKTTLGNWMSGPKKKIEWKVKSLPALILFEFSTSFSRQSYEAIEIVERWAKQSAQHTCF